MQSLKKKFGKFAVSTEKMAKVNGGGNFHCVGRNGQTLETPSLWSAGRFVETHGGGCSN